jgi:hypothetical protein
MSVDEVSTTAQLMTTILEVCGFALVMVNFKIIDRNCNRTCDSLCYKRRTYMKT